VLTHAEVMENAQSYLRQFFKVVDRDRTQVVEQSEWFGKFTLANIIDLTGRFTVAQFLQRADYAKRIAEEQPIALTELLYPLLQAYDSVVIEADVEFGGTDQLFNLGIGREMQRSMGQTPQQCFLMPILPGTDGVQKMSKSLDNYIAVDEAPADMYGKVMSIADNMIVPYYELLTDLPAAALTDLERDIDQESVNPMEHKKRLAWDITRQFHDAASADGAQAHFENVVQGRNLPEDIPEVCLELLVDLLPSPDDNVSVSSTIALQQRGPDGTLQSLGVRCDLLMVAAELAASNAEARRLVSQGAVELTRRNGTVERWADPRAIVNVAIGDVLRAGRRRFVRFTA
jgi:tyrosyl-tRNA synthetase